MEKAKMTGAFVRRKIAWLAGSESGISIQGNLSQTAPRHRKKPGSSPELWEATFQDMPPN